MIYKILHRKLKIQQPLKTGVELRSSRKTSSSCFTSYIRSVTAKRNEHHMIWKSRWTPVYENKFK